MTTLITPLPTPPTRQDSSSFNDRADDFLGALPLFQQEANSLAIDVQSSAADVEVAKQAVISIVDITKWVSGNSYAEGASVWSPINGVAYRKVSSSIGGTTDPSLDNVNYKSITDAAGFTYTPSGVGAVTTTVEDKLRENVSVSDKGAVTLSTINAVIAEVSDGVITIPPGEYELNGDVLIQLKNSGSTAEPQGSLKIIAEGVRFTGTGKVIIDSCKRLTITGLDAPNHDLCLRGCWWSTFSGMRFRNIVFSDAVGSSFTSNYWCQWNECLFQTVITGAASTFNNKMDWFSCSMRGNANQGFQGTANYAFEFNANENAQGWVFWGGDVSYHNTAIYNVGVANTAGDIEITFDGTYFDTLIPAPISRARSRVQTKNCHYANSANGHPNSAVLSAVARGSQDLFRQDRSAAWAQHTGVNFVPNGDLRVGLASYAGAGRPVGSSGGSTITSSTSAGLMGRYININQTNLGPAGQVRIRPLPLPFAGRYTGVLVLRNANTGSRSMRIAFNDLFESISISNTEWTLFTLTSGVDIAAGAQPDIIIRADDDTSTFSVDVCYMAVSFGEGGMPFTLSPSHKVIEAEVTYDPPSIAGGASVTTTVSAVGAAFGDFVSASFGRSTAGITISASVSAADTISVTFTNPTAGSIDLLSSTLRVRVSKSGYA